ncbi:hypothetical protein GLAREA_08345 [Glarea lozoyensis ATCC 20868]|uniref:Uncharacterized protein n=1 Tax=Glarea lozoyensis (strain ATCC 20868 / MF5171) TaxID=1116229 RepID=S3DCS1_GLAL2|nr:uncharacterized protein GLAREA_08345 [Glarea lozoyensis ATCC 20868]EPE24493.1 hypothetical protein GLAREA_08345 [Glarea lozoyensis ATCC 20868]
MLLTRPLPPQFLLPAWSSSLLAIANEQQQRAHTFSLKSRGRRTLWGRASKEQKPEIRGPPRAFSRSKQKAAQWNVIPKRQEGLSRSSPPESTWSPQSTPRIRETRLEVPQDAHPPNSIPSNSQIASAQANLQPEGLFVEQSLEPTVSSTSSGEAKLLEGLEGREEGEKNRQDSESNVGPRPHDDRATGPHATTREPKTDKLPTPLETLPPEFENLFSPQRESAYPWRPHRLEQSHSTASEVQTTTTSVTSDPSQTPLFRRATGYIRPPSSQTLERKRWSLFEELFPGDAKDVKRKEGGKSSKKLPSFAWQMERQKEKERQKALRPRTMRSIPLSQNEGPAVVESIADIRKQRREASVLVLNGALSSLAESDFFRVGPKGDHIQRWTHGIIKVIPGRHTQTLQSQDHYFILFTDSASARAYMDSIYRLYKLSRAALRGATGISAFEVRPDFLKHGEDVQSLVRGFTLVPAHSELYLRLIDKPYRPAMSRLLEDGGPTAEVTRRSQAEDKVLLYPDFGNIAMYELRKALLEDGRRRNLHWGLADGDDAVLSLRQATTQVQGENIESAITGRGFRRPERYVISFKNRLEARRFAREWHRRPFPLSDRRSQAEEPPTINAEILW